MENILGGGEWMNLAIHRMPFANVYPPIASFIFNCSCTHSSLANIFPPKFSHTVIIYLTLLAIHTLKINNIDY